MDLWIANSALEKKKKKEKNYSSLANPTRPAAPKVRTVQGPGVMTTLLGSVRTDFWGLRSHPSGSMILSGSRRILIGLDKDIVTIPQSNQFTVVLQYPFANPLAFLPRRPFPPAT